jgi:hypothetical protein
MKTKSAILDICHGMLIALCLGFVFIACDNLDGCDNLIVAHKVAKKIQCKDTETSFMTVTHCDTTAEHWEQGPK